MFVVRYLFIALLFVFLLYFSNKLQIKHNFESDSNEDSEESNTEVKKNKSGKDEEDMCEMEMTLDDKLYEGDLKDIKEGGFVSFRYIKTSHGITTPKVSFIIVAKHIW